MSNDVFPLADFPAAARLFPLPNLVLFPRVVQPLHIFEPRYRQMTADALGDDRLIAMALLRPGWETHYEARPAIYSVACLGQILAEQRLDDGRYNLLLRGVARVRVVQEIKHNKLYRSAAVELLAETLLADQATTDGLRQQLVEVVRPWFAGQAEAGEQLQRLLDSDPELGALCDALAFALPLTPAQQQELLEEADAARRVTALLRQLRDKDEAVSGRTFPPTFSVN